MLEVPMKSKITSIVIILGLMGTLGGCVTADNFNPQDATTARLNLAEEYLRLGNFNLAKQNLDKAREYSPQDAKVLSAYGTFYFQQENLEQAMEFYKQAIKLAPQNGNYKNNYAISLCKTNHFKEALNLFKEALASPNYHYLTATYENIIQCAESANNEEMVTRYKAKLAKLQRKVTI